MGEADNVDKLAKLAELHEKDLLTQKEFEAEKAKLLSQSDEQPATVREDKNTAADPHRLLLLVAILAALLHAGWAVVFYALDQPTVARWDVAAVAVHLTGAAFIARGRPFLGIWIVLASASVHIAMFLIALGVDSGFGYYFLALLAAPLLFQEHAGHVVGTGVLLLASAVAGVAGASVWGPWVTLDDTVLDAIQAANLLGATATAVTVVVAGRCHESAHPSTARLLAAGGHRSQAARPVHAGRQDRRGRHGPGLPRHACAACVARPPSSSCPRAK